MERFAYLSDALTTEGWTIEQAELESYCWWAKEIWRLKSTWSPFGKTIYLSLIMDPSGDFDIHNPPDSSVWDIGLSHDIPEHNRDPKMHTFQILRRIKDKIPQVVATANAMRLDQL